MREPAGGLSEFLLYQTEGGETRVQVSLFEGTVWLTQRLIAELYQKSIKTINEHIKNTYEERELDPQATIRKFRIVQLEDDRQVERLVDFYNLDVILAVGYRVRSHRGTQFRQWATKQLREYVVLPTARNTAGYRLFAFAEACPKSSIVQQSVAQIPLGTRTSGLSVTPDGVRAKLDECQTTVRYRGV